MPASVGRAYHVAGVILHGWVNMRACSGSQGRYEIPSPDDAHPPVGALEVGSSAAEAVAAGKQLLDIRVGGVIATAVSGRR